MRRRGLDVAKGPRRSDGGAAVVFVPGGLGLTAFGSGPLRRGPCVIEQVGVMSDLLGLPGVEFFPMIVGEGNLRLLNPTLAATRGRGVQLLHYGLAAGARDGFGFATAGKEFIEWWVGRWVPWSAWAPALFVDTTVNGFTDEWDMWVRYSYLESR